MTRPDWLGVERGGAPLLVSLPHTGTDIPPEIDARLVSPELGRKDTDWWVDRLYGFVRELDATVIRTALSRTVIDVNRDPSGHSLYPGMATTELVPTVTFDGEPLYRDGAAPDPAEIEARRARWFEPYHAALTEELTRLRGRHPRVVLYDCHSIRSVVPRLFEGKLPVLNLGTNGGRSCDPSLREALTQVCAGSGLPHVTDGRFKGGWTTRHYGRPTTGVHAVQMELAQRAYMDELPPRWDEVKAAGLQAHLRELVEAVLAWTGGGR